MARIKIRKKDLKVDELRTFGHGVYEFVKNHQNKVMIGLGILCVILIGLKLYGVTRRETLRQTNDLFTQASNSFQMGLMSTTLEDRVKNLNTCIENCKRILQDYGSSPLAQNVLYLQGSALFFKANVADDYDECISIFNQYIDRAGLEKDMAVGYVALGYSYENKYFLTEDRSYLSQAVKAYEKAIETGKDSTVGAEGKMCKGRLLELQYKDDEASILYESVKEQRKLKPLVASVPDAQFRDPQLNFMNNQLNTMKDLFSFSHSAQMALERLEGQK